ncbi:hypothetical protein ElyMa_006780400 [Elysia marginata]|uniref:Uncharacterized protein n=1 Tax=Elysia marginata TaxID=1093978 RepID=A0AAV4IZG7_9GAST|nr:hypothetical protein ElyMa_006780400 [Elysia marginata]
MCIGCLLKCLGKAAIDTIKGVCKCIPEFTPRPEDLMIFEFGWPKTYFLWRCSCFLLVTGLVLALPVPSTLSSYLVDLKYMHGWLIWLLVLGLGVETLVIGWVMLMYPSWQLEKSDLPLSLRAVWTQYAVIYPNILSCALMYNVGFSDFSHDVPQKATLQHLITFYALLHVFTTATPSHLFHVIKPFVLNFIYILFTIIWQLAIPFDYGSVANNLISAAKNSSLSQPLEGAKSFISSITTQRDVIYRSLDWKDWPKASGVAVLWVVCTVACHTFMMLVTWGRRQGFHNIRKVRFDFHDFERRNRVEHLRPVVETKDDDDCSETKGVTIATLGHGISAP